MAQKFTLSLLAASDEHRTDVWVEHLGSAEPISQYHRELIEEEIRERVRQSCSVTTPHSRHFIGAVGEIFHSRSGHNDAILIMEWFNTVMEFNAFQKRLGSLLQ